MENLQTLNLDQLLETYLNTLHEQETIEATVKVIRDEMALRLDKEGKKGTVVGDYSITKVIRTNFRPTIEQARELAATVMVESIDMQALRRLHDQGVTIPNTTQTEFVLVKPVEKKE